MSAEQGADELRIRATLIKQGVGPDADAPPPSRPMVPPKPTARPRDWLDNLLDDNATPADGEGQADEVEDEEAPEAEAPTEPKSTTATKTKQQAKPRKRKKRKARRPGPNTPHTPWDTRPQDPRQSLMDAYDRIPYRLKWLGYHASAAYLGWTCGLVDYATYITRWIADTGFGPQAWFWCGVGVATLVLHQCTRDLRWAAAWCCAVPATSTVVGVLLYVPTP